MPTMLCASVTISASPCAMPIVPSVDDERRDADPRGQRAVREPERRAERERGAQRRGRPSRCRPTVAASTTLATRQHRAHREIDALGQDDQRHRQREHAAGSSTACRCSPRLARVEEPFAGDARRSGTAPRACRRRPDARPLEARGRARDAGREPDGAARRADRVRHGASPAAGCSPRSARCAPSSPTMRRSRIT